MMNLVISNLAFVIAMSSPSPKTSVSVGSADAKCGLYCLSVGLFALGGKDHTIERIEERLGPPGAMGYSLAQLADAAKSNGFETISIRTSIDHLTFRRNSLGERFVCIASYGPEHFVMIYGSDGKIVRIADPPRTYTLDLPVFEREWSGHCLLIGTMPLASEEIILAKRRTRDIILRIGATIGSVLSIAVIGVAISRLWSRARKHLAAAGVIVCILCGCTDSNGNSSGSQDDPPFDKTNEIAGAWIEVRPARHSLGVLRAGDGRMVPLVSRIRNNSDQLVRITGVTVSCACTKAMVDKSVLNPGESAELKSNVKIGETQGHRTATIKIESNDPVRPISEIMIDWVADLPLKTDPLSIERFELSPVARNEFEIAMISKFVTLCEKCEIRTSEAPDSLSFSWFPNRDINFRGHAAKVDDSEETRLGTLKLNVEAGDRDLHHQERIEIVLECGGKTLAKTLFPMTWTFRRSYSVVPSRVYFGTSKSGKTATQSILLQSMNGEKIVVRSMKLRNDGIPLDTKIDRVSDTVSKIALTIRAPSKPGPWTDEIEIETDSKEQPIIKVPVSCLVE